MKPLCRKQVGLSPVRIVALAVAGTLLVAPTTASAQRNGGLGTGIAIGIGAGLLLNELGKAAGAKAAPAPNNPSSTRRRERKSEDTANETSKPKTADERAADARNYAAQQAELAEIRRTERLEQERDVDQAIRSFVALLERWHKDLRNNQSANVRVSSGANINQVTDGEIRRAVDAAYKSARLYEFERLAGEIWTKDRLTVRVLDYSRKELDQYFRGIGVKGTSMSDLEQVFEASARQVYAHALQVAELIGVSHSFDRFIRTIYEHSDRADESLSTIGADGRYERLVAVLVDGVPRETFISDSQSLASDALGLDKQFLFRFRARRVLYDCMAARYATLLNPAGRPGASQNQLMVSGPAQTTPVAARVGGSDASEGLWDRMNQFVSTSCREPLGGVMTEAKDGRMRPQPARWDSSGGDASLGGRPGLMPTTNYQPR